MKKKRIQLDMSESDLAKLEAMKEASGSVSVAQVIRDSLRFYSWLIGEAKKNHVLKSEDLQSGESVRVEFPSLS